MEKKVKPESEDQLLYPHHASSHATSPPNNPESPHTHRCENMSLPTLYFPTHRFLLIEFVML
jgi:hypothetical protein